MAAKQPDWEAIERAFRAGALSIRTIVDRNGVSDTAIRKKAKASGWERDLTEQVRKEVRNKLVRGEVREGQCANPERDAEIIEEAAEEKRARRLFAATAATFAKPRTSRTC